MGPAGCSGFLVPRSEGRLMTACSFASHKWPHWADEGRSVVRVSAGRAGDGRATGLSDDELSSRLIDELGQAFGAARAAEQPSDQPVARGLSPIRSGPRPPRAATGGRAAAGPAHRGSGRGLLPRGGGASLYRLGPPGGASRARAAGSCPPPPDRRPGGQALRPGGRGRRSGPPLRLPRLAPRADGHRGLSAFAERFGHSGHIDDAREGLTPEKARTGSAPKRA